ncbi:hypothetical protein CCAX7_25920 [Capsulimonas corticalis]|uniref:Uncharacterized protein n=1 Tax=Capsulimonas corticalis TaxID=2219043 RepID=A0A402CVV1_9BACT|nr:hypothetical protein [Capsulimonas corticalis]BDI30541.1 hypothetical protein CCAX7_25920 [Capsulimonas corticalis]
MALHALTQADDIAAAYHQLTEELKNGSVPYERNVGWRGGGEQHTVHWHPGAGLWGLSAVAVDGTGYWFAFGTNDPAQTNQFGSISVQFSFYREGVSRRCGGAFAFNNTNGQVNLLHSGGIGGGRNGISKTSFLAAYNGPLEDIRWPNGATFRYVDIGSLEEPGLIGRLAAFVGAVETFKASVPVATGIPH